MIHSQSQPTGREAWQGRRRETGTCACHGSTPGRRRTSTPVTSFASRPSASGTPPTMSSCHSCIGASRSHHRYCLLCHCSCGLTRPFRAITRWTVARDPAPPELSGEPAGTPARMLPPQLADQRLHLGIHPRRLDFGHRDRSTRPGMPSASNRLRHECSDCHVVPYRSATSPIGDPPSTSRTARYQYSASACWSTQPRPPHGPDPNHPIRESSRRNVNHVLRTNGQGSTETTQRHIPPQRPVTGDKALRAHPRVRHPPCHPAPER
jgi:hypothetical protein